jgi:Dynein heavy chain AAA lid domain
MKLVFVIYLKVMYGGRAIDDFDRRVLKTYMDEYMGDFIFDTFQPFHFYHNNEVDYKIPEDGSRDSYIGQSYIGKVAALEYIVLSPSLLFITNP